MLGVYVFSKRGREQGVCSTSSICRSKIHLLTGFREPLIIYIYLIIYVTPVRKMSSVITGSGSGTTVVLKLFIVKAMREPVRLREF